MKLSVIAWRSWKLRRVAVSSNDAEVQSIFETEDVNWKLRMLWAELNGGTEPSKGAVHRADQGVSKTYGIVATDSKGGYDAVKLNEGSTLGLSNSRTAVQAYQLKQNFQDARLSLCWVAADWNLADGLTKESAESRKSLLEFLKNFKWSLKYDPLFRSARKTKQETGKHAVDSLKQEEGQQKLGQ